ncbi:MAG: hypothetical protein ACOCP4_01725 [Candidatus Woesearchaeota archaeon]
MDKFIKITLPYFYKTNNMIIEQLSCLLSIEPNKQVNEQRYKLKFDINDHYNEQKCDEYAQLIADILVENDIKEFEIDFSTGIDSDVILNEDSDFIHNQETPEFVDVFDDIDYDVVNDLLVYMKNDNNFYHNFYYPTMHNIAKKYKKTKKLEMNKPIKRLVDSAIVQYCKEYDIHEHPDKMFGNEEKSEIISKLIREEEQELQKGEYI